MGAVLQIAIVVALAAMLFPWIRRRLKTAGLLTVGAILIFALVVTLTQEFR